jgi:hypothetical protein
MAENAKIAAGLSDKDAVKPDVLQKIGGSYGYR